jgi:hypothetical protein
LAGEVLVKQGADLIAGAKETVLEENEKCTCLKKQQKRQRSCEKGSLPFVISEYARKQENCRSGSG